MKEDGSINRKWFFSTIILGVILIVSLFFNIRVFFKQSNTSKSFDVDDIGKSSKIIGLEFSRREILQMTEDLKDNLKAYLQMRQFDLDNSVFPAVQFNPLMPDVSRAVIKEPDWKAFTLKEIPGLKAPANLEDLAFEPVTVLARFIKSRQVSSTALTKMYIARLKRYDPLLKCVVTLTEERALAQAARADEEIASGLYRGPLHGIPYGVKDLLAVKGYKTTWGTPPFKDQVIDLDATVVERLEKAGAVLVAKLTLGELAWGDVWTLGKTRNPWNPSRGSSGSSAGPASATSAGLVGFSIGTETWGSIISPSTECGVTGFRPTYGRVSRYGAMALSWSMDKIGPICRSAEDCTLVFNAIYGPDGKDFTLIDQPFDWNPSRDIKSLRIGFVKDLFEKKYPTRSNDLAVLEKLRGMGARLVPIQCPKFPVENLAFILNAEAAAAFDQLSRSGKDDLMVRQERYAWPNVFRHSRFIPAVEYIRANRFRTLLIHEMALLFKNIDVYIVPSFGGENLLLTNLTGHPAVVIPNGFDKDKIPTSITIVGDLFHDADALSAAKIVQDSTDFHKKHPVLK